MRRLYTNGKVLCVESGEYTEAVLTEDDRILAVGEARYLRDLGGRRTETVDLEGGILAPGFVDCGGRFLRDAESCDRLDLSLGLTDEGADSENGDGIGGGMENGIGSRNSNGEPDMLRLLRLLGDWDRTYPDTPGGVLVAEGLPLDWGQALYRDNSPVFELFSYRPLLIVEAGGARGFVNRVAMEKWRLPQEDGGILRQPYLQELLGRLPEPSFAQRRQALERTQERYGARGVTTLWESRVTAAHLPWLRSRRREHGGGLALYGDGDIWDYERIRRAYPTPLADFCLRGVHVTLDGPSVRGLAFMRQPEGEAVGALEQSLSRSLLSPVSRQSGQYLSDRAVSLALSLAISQKTGISFEACGDGAVEQVSRVALSMDRARPAFGGLRPVLTGVTHLCPSREKLDVLRRCGMVPVLALGALPECFESLCGTLGWPVASGACPGGTLTRCHVPFALSSAPLHGLPRPLETAAFAARRLSREGVSMGERESVSYFEAIRAMTLMGAYALGLEDRVGSIRAGKEANFVWLEGSELSEAVLRGTFAGRHFFPAEKQNGFSTLQTRVPSVY